MEILRTRIGRQLLLAFLLTLLVCGLAVAWVTLQQASAKIREQSHARLLAAADGAEAHVLEFLAYLKSRSLDFSTDGFIRDSMDALAGDGRAAARACGECQRTIAAALNTHLADKASVFPEAVETFVLDPAGRVAASSDPSRVGHDYSTADYFLQGRQTVFVSDIFRDDVTGQATWVVSAPLTSRTSGALVGMIANRIDPQTLSSLIAGRRALAMGDSTQFVRPGQTGETYIVNRDRLMITESRFLDDAVLRVTVNTEPVRRTVEQGEGMTGEYAGYRGVPVSGASVLIDEMGWVIISEIDLSEAALPAEALQREVWKNLIGLGVGFGLIVLLMTGVLARRIVRPMRRMTAANLAAGRGGALGGLIPEAEMPDDEFGEVIRTRNAMLAHLAEADLVFESMLDAVVVANPDGTVRMMNHAALELLGCTAAEVAGQPIGTFFAEEEEEEEDTFFRGTGLARLVREGAAREVETTLITRTGERVPVVFNGSVVRGADGAVLAVVGVARDMRPTRRLIREAQARAEEAHTPETIAEALNRAAGLEEALDRSLAAIMDTTGSESGWIVLLDKSGKSQLAAARNLPPALEANDRAAMRWYGCTCQFQLVAGNLTKAGNILKCERLALAQGDKRGLRYHAAVPIRVEGRTLGNLNVTTPADRVFTESELNLLTAVGDQIGVAVERARLFTEAQRNLQRLEALYAVGRAIASLSQLSEVCQSIVREVSVTLGYGAAAVLLLDREREELFEIAYHGHALQRPDSRLKLGEGLSSRAVLTGQAHITPDVTLEPAYVPGVPGCRSEADIPIKLRGEVVGVLAVEDVRVNAYSPEDVAQLTAVADQAAVAIENARLYEQMRVQRIEEQAALLKLSQALLSETGAQAMMDVAVRAAAEALKVEFAAIVLIDAEAQTYSGRAGVGWPPEVAQQAQRLPLTANTGVAYAIRTGAPVVIPDQSRETRCKTPPWVTQMGVVSSLLVPMLADGEAIGTLSVSSRTRRDWTDDEVRLLSLIANDTAQALERARLFEAEREQRELAEALREAVTALSASLDFDALLDGLLENLAKVAPFDSGNVMLLDAQTGRIRVARQRGYEQFGEQVVRDVAGLSFELAATPNLRRMAETGRPLVIPDTAADPGWVKVEASAHVRSWAGAPLVVRDQVVAFFSLDKVEPGFYRPGHGERLAAFAAQAALALQNARLFQAIHRQLQELTALHAVAVVGTEAFDEDTLIERATEIVGATFYPTSFGVLLADEATGELRVHPSYRDSLDEMQMRTIPAGYGVVGRAVATGQPQRVPDVSREPTYLEAARHTRSELCVPLKAGERVLGAINAESAQFDAFSQADERLLTTIAGQLATAIEKARLFGATAARSAQLRRLYELAALLTGDPQEVFDRVATILAEQFATGWATVERLADDRLNILSMWHDGRVIRGGDYPLRGTPCQNVAAERRPCRFDRAADLFPEDAFLRDFGVQTYLGVPVLDSAGRVIGVLNVMDDRWRVFSDDDVQLLTIFAQRVGAEMERQRELEVKRAAAEALAQQAAEIAALYRASSQLLNPTEEISVVAGQIARAVTGEFAFTHCNVALKERSADELRVVASVGDLPSMINSLPVDGPGLMAAAARSGEIVFAPDVAADPRYLVGNPHTRSEIAVPMHIGSRLIGVLDLQSREPDAFDERARRILTAFAESAALALENTQLLESLERARRVAEEASQLKSEFLANTSHELRTPLAAILGALSVVLDGLCDSPDEERKFIRMAGESSRHMLAIVNDLLDIARIEAGRMEVQAAAFDLAPLLAEVQALCRAQAEEKGLRLEVHPLPAPFVWADPDKVRQILINLVANAIKFTERGGVTVRAYSDGDGQMQIVVEDTGVGIPSDKQAKLFQPFVQVDGSMTRKYSGTGLGLSISRRLAEMMGGTVTLHSAGEGQGSTLTISLPVASSQ
ncbi:MAG: GAF domain-containing protein [Chloroflexi bacterium]|nr:GAF domain-containing protein [Chloroflexota bacterium]